MLLDTHVLLWLLADDPQLGPETRKAMVAAPVLNASTLTLWEVAIKSDLGKLTVPDDFPDRVTESGIEWLDMSARQAWRIRQITGMPHKDPFDKMLVTVSATLDTPLVTADRALLSASLSPTIKLIDARQ